MSVVSFNNKMKWLLSYDRNHLKRHCTDKLLLKKYVQDKLGPGFTPKTYVISNSTKELVSNIKKQKNHPENFFVKSNNDSGGTLLCSINNISNINLNLIEKYKNRPYGIQSNEWFYNNIKYKCFTEEIIGYNLIDYKFHCVYGVPRFCQVIKDRNTTTNEICVDMNSNILNFHFDNLFKRSNNFVKPDKWDAMIEIAKELSADFNYVRVDMYNTGSIYVGELTFSPRAGMYAGNGQIDAGKLLTLL